MCTEISAGSIIIQYWHGADGINVAAWITLIIIIVVSLNIFAVSMYGEAEFVFASIKLLAIVGLLLFALIIDLGGGPTHDRLGFRYWNHPGAMKAYIGTGSTGRFLGFFAVMANATFAYSGVEMVAVAAGEAENPRKNIPKAVRRVFWRIIFFYVLGSLAIGVLIPYNEPRLLNAQDNNLAGGAASPWVIAIYRASVPGLPSVINAVILTSATSSGNAFLYTGSRYLYALAQNGQAPRILLTCSKAYVDFPTPNPNIKSTNTHPAASLTTASSQQPPCPSSPTSPAAPPPPTSSSGSRTSPPSPCSSPGCPFPSPTSASTPPSPPTPSRAPRLSSKPPFNPTSPGSRSPFSPPSPSSMAFGLSRAKRDRLMQRGL